MEIVLLLLLVVMVLVLRTMRRRSRNIRRNNNATVKTHPFGANSAKSNTCKTILSGRAYIVDGDSLVIQKIQIRLFGVDAPELNHPFGQNAKWALFSLCKGQIVRAEIIQQDDYGRAVARCFLQDGSDLSAAMVKLGLAIDWPKFSRGQYRALEVPGVRKKLWLADARQKGRIHVWEQFEAKQNNLTTKN